MIKKENTPYIETERLILRKFIESDIPDMFRIYSDTEVNTFLPWFPLESEEETREYLHDHIFAEYKKEIAYRYAIVWKKTNHVIGYVSIGSIDEEQACGDLGYGLMKDYWNRGIMAEASKAVLEKAEENGFRYVTATHDINNPSSGKVMLKSGMTYRYSYDEQWQPKDFKVTFKLYRIDFDS